MKLELLFLGKTKERYLANGIEDFRKRLARYNPVEIRYIKIGSHKGRDEAAIKLHESELLDTRVEAGDYRIALDASGSLIGSEEFAELLTELEQTHIKRLCFILGGALGLDRKQIHAADRVLSLSKMTFTHDMARLILLEQLYRAYSIKAGSKYHK